MEKLPAHAYEEGRGLLGVEVCAVLDGVVRGLPLGLLLPLRLVRQEVVPGQRVKRRPFKQIKQVLETSLGDIRLERDTIRKRYDSKVLFSECSFGNSTSSSSFIEPSISWRKKSRQIGGRKMSSLFINRTASMVTSSHPLLTY